MKCTLQFAKTLISRKKLTIRLPSYLVQFNIILLFYEVFKILREKFKCTIFNLNLMQTTKTDVLNKKLDRRNHKCLT